MSNVYLKENVIYGIISSLREMYIQLFSNTALSTQYVFLRKLYERKTIQF
jgi:hypothetical protein